MPLAASPTKTYGRALWAAFGRNTRRFQPPTPITSTSRTTSGQLDSQIQRPIITGRNKIQTADQAAGDLTISTGHGALRTT